MIRLGNRDLKNITFPAGIDAEAVALRTKLTGGVLLSTILTDINDALNLKQASVFASPLIASITGITNQVEVTYRSGSTGGFEKHTEYGEPDEQRSDEAGHMMPVERYDRALGWGKEFLENARQDQIDSDVADATDDYEDLAEKTILRALFRQEALSGKQNGLGNNGKAVAFCDGGRGGVSYTPPRGRGGKVFDATHDHYFRQSEISQANLELVVETVWEHKHDAPFTAIVSEADLDQWTDKTKVNFIEKGIAGVNYGANQTLAAVGEEFYGIIRTKRGLVYLMTNSRVDEGYWNLHKSYGSNNPRNPLWIYENPKYTLAPQLEIPVPRPLPIQGAIILVTYGANVGRDRTNGACVRVAAAGVYESPENLMS